MLDSYIDPAEEDKWDFNEFANKITDTIYLGSEESAKVQLKQLKDRNITHILMVGTKIELGEGKYRKEKEMNYLHLQLQDEVGANIQQYFRAAILFIKGAVEKKECVLVHCVMGFSRSATIVAAWLMFSENLSSTQAIARIEARRNVGPNGGFRIQLREFESSKENVLNPEPSVLERLQNIKAKEKKEEKKTTRCC